MAVFIPQWSWWGLSFPFSRKVYLPLYIDLLYKLTSTPSMWHTMAILMAILPRWIQRTERESSQCSWQCAGQKGQIQTDFLTWRNWIQVGTGILLYQRTFFTSSQWWINWFDDPISWGTFCEDNFNKARCDYRFTVSKDVGRSGQSVGSLWWMDGQVLADEGRKAEGDEALKFAGILWFLF